MAVAGTMPVNNNPIEPESCFGKALFLYTFLIERSGNNEQKKP